MAAKHTSAWNTALAGALSAGWGASRPAADAAVLDRASLFAEAVHQAKPLAKRGTSFATRSRSFVRQGSARHGALRLPTVERLITRPRPLSDFTRGRYPAAKTAEVVVAHDYKAALSGRDPGIVNGVKHRSPHVVDVRLSPDGAARRDIVFVIRGSRRIRFCAPGGQVKSGGARYISRSLRGFTAKADYGGTVYLDGRRAGGLRCLKQHSGIIAWTRALKRS